jgi:hypothetical protein
MCAIPFWAAPAKFLLQTLFLWQRARKGTYCTSSGLVGSLYFGAQAKQQRKDTGTRDANPKPFALVFRLWHPPKFRIERSITPDN